MHTDLQQLVYHTEKQKIFLVATILKVYHREHLFVILIYKITKISDSRENRALPLL